MRRTGIAMIFLALSSALPVLAATAEGQSIGVDEDRAARWNRFADGVLQLHKRLTAGDAVRKQTSTGGYQGEFFNRADYYVEEIYHSVDGDRLISNIKWEKDNPANLHMLEVYLYDENNRVTRDYLVNYLPWGRNAPIQAMVNLHSYNKGLHGFRQFDASGELIFEKCEGTLDGKPVDIDLESYEIEPPVTTQKDYLLCFSGLPTQAGKYLTPQ